MYNPFRGVARAAYRIYVNLNRICHGMAEEVKARDEPEVANVQEQPPKGVCAVCLKIDSVEVLDRENWKFKMLLHNDGNWWCRGSNKTPCEVFWPKG